MSACVECLARREPGSMASYFRNLGTLAINVYGPTRAIETFKSTELTRSKVRQDGSSNRRRKGKSLGGLVLGGNISTVGRHSTHVSLSCRKDVIGAQCCAVLTSTLPTRRVGTMR